MLQRNKVDDGAAADAGCTQQPVTQVPDGAGQQQAECRRPAADRSSGALMTISTATATAMPVNTTVAAGAKEKAAPGLRET